MTQEVPRLFVASDLEGTLSSGVTWEAMRSYLLKEGQEAAYNRFFRRMLPSYLLYKAKLVEERRFKERWILEMLRLFAGYSPEQFRDLSQWVVEKELWPKRRQAVVEELLAHQANGRFVVILSGMFQPMLDLFAAKMGVKGVGTAVSFVDGQFTGEIVGQLNVGVQKAATLQALLDGGQLLAAYGDTYRDIPMLEMAQEPVAVYPDDRLRQTAVSRGWRILTD